MSIRISVLVKPQARKSGIRRIAEHAFEVSVHAPAREGKANDAVIALLAEHFCLPKSLVRMVHGRSGRKKIFDIG